MSSMDEDSEYSGSDSDAELQEAFARNELKPGTHVLVPFVKKRPVINNIDGMNDKLLEIKLDLSWIERLDMVNMPAPLAPELAANLEKDRESKGGQRDQNDDFQRELLFYRQAQSAIMEALPKLKSLNILIKRPDDYFAQMAKSDEHMEKVRESLVNKQLVMERREKARKLRELKKYGKQVQQEVLQKRQQEKKQLMENVKKFRKGQKNNLDFLDGETGGTKINNETGKKKKNNTSGKRGVARRAFKDKKYGFGGQRKRSKYNDAESFANPFESKGKKGRNPKGKLMGIKGKGKGRRKGQIISF